MEMIRIPRMQIWHEENAVYVSLRRFVHLCERLCRGRRKTGNGAAPIVVLRAVLVEPKLPIPALHELFHHLSCAAFVYRPPDTKLPDSLPVDLFSSSDTDRWEKQTACLKKLTIQYTEVIHKLMGIQERCWKSRARMKEAASMVEAAELSVNHYIDNEREFHARNAEIKKLIKELKDKQTRHAANVNMYQCTLAEEVHIRSALREGSDSLQEKITQCLAGHISQAWSCLNKATITERFPNLVNYTEISKELYHATCRVFHMNIPNSDVSSVAFNINIKRPVLHKSMYQDAIIQEPAETYEICNMKGEVSRADPYPAKYFLRTKKGDSVKVKLVSGDVEVAFGYVRNFRFALRKWGFMRMDDIEHLRDSLTEHPVEPARRPDEAEYINEVNAQCNTAIVRLSDVDIRCNTSSDHTKGQSIRVVIANDLEAPDDVHHFGPGMRARRVDITKFLRDSHSGSSEEPDVNMDTEEDEKLCV